MDFEERNDCGQRNIVNSVATKKVVLTPWHIKLGFRRQLVNAMNSDKACLQYLFTTFSRISVEKIKAGIFNGPLFRLLMKNF